MIYLLPRSVSKNGPLRQWLLFQRGQHCTVSLVLETVALDFCLWHMSHISDTILWRHRDNEPNNSVLEFYPNPYLLQSVLQTSPLCISSSSSLTFFFGIINWLLVVFPSALSHILFTRPFSSTSEFHWTHIVLKLDPYCIRNLTPILSVFIIPFKVSTRANIGVF